MQMIIEARLVDDRCERSTANSAAGQCRLHFGRQTLHTIPNRRPT
jgi:hypothetical protein